MTGESVEPTEIRERAPVEKLAYLQGYEAAILTMEALMRRASAEDTLETLKTTAAAIRTALPPEVTGEGGLPTAPPGPVGTDQGGIKPDVRSH